MILRTCIKSTKHKNTILKTSQKGDNPYNGNQTDLKL